MQIISVYTLETPPGRMIAGLSPAGVHTLFFEGGKADYLKKYRNKVPGNQNDSLYELLKKELEGYFSGDLKSFTIPVIPSGTPFQMEVWKQLREIPYGSIISYSELAEQGPGAESVRAVASANGQNPVAIIIPCHRVVGRNGKLTGYAWGIEKKRYLIQHEQKYTHEPGASSNGQMEIF